MPHHALSDSNPRVIMIAGNMASGKSTVAQALAERLPKSVHLRGDIFRRMIINGQAEMGAELSDEAKRQLDLRYRLAAESARLYRKAGFNVVYQDVILGSGLTEVTHLHQGHPLSLFVLCPNPEVVAQREASRHKRGYADQEAILAFDAILHNETPQIGYWVDSSLLTVDETVEEMLRHWQEAVLW